MGESNRADWKKLCVSGNPTDPTKRGPTLNILFHYFFFPKMTFQSPLERNNAFLLGLLDFVFRGKTATKYKS